MTSVRSISLTSLNLIANNKNFIIIEQEKEEDKPVKFTRTSQTKQRIIKSTIPKTTNIPAPSQPEQISGQELYEEFCELKNKKAVFEALATTSQEQRVKIKETFEIIKKNYFVSSKKVKTPNLPKTNFIEELRQIKMY